MKKKLKNSICLEKLEGFLPGMTDWAISELHNYYIEKCGLDYSKVINDESDKHLCKMVKKASKYIFYYEGFHYVTHPSIVSEFKWFYNDAVRIHKEYNWPIS